MLIMWLMDKVTDVSVRVYFIHELSAVLTLHSTVVTMTPHLKEQMKFRNNYKFDNSLTNELVKCI